jgi:hypothetical protein
MSLELENHVCTIILLWWEAASKKYSSEHAHTNIKINGHTNKRNIVDVLVTNMPT